MNSTINLGNNLSIGIDSNIIGAGVGCMLNTNTRIFGLTLFCFFLLIKLPRVTNKVYTFKMIDHKLAKVNGKHYFIKIHETFTPKVIYIRVKPTGILQPVTKFKLMEDLSFKGVLVRDAVKHTTDFYEQDEFEYFLKDNRVKGYLKGDIITVLSIVD